MKILHLAAGNRWTGAAAPAFAEVEALRAAGIDAHFAYVGGYRLEAKIGHHDFAHAAIRKSQNPFTFKWTLDALDRLLGEQRFDVVHAHLTYDHLLARIAVRNRNVRVARTFHSRRVLRADLFTRWLVKGTQHLFVINEAFAGAPALNGRPAVFTPPPLDHRQFSPSGADMRAHYGIAPATRLITVIGKLAAGRGFEAALSTFAVLRRSRDDVRMMIIGHGEHRPLLEVHASRLGITEDVIWAGYHEDDLAEHYRAANLLLFTARGSDEGHRAVLEAMACGVPVASYPVEGVAALIGPERVAPSATPEALAATANEALANSTDVYARSLAFGYDKAAERLMAGYTA